MDNELHKIVDYKEWLKDKLSDTKSDLISDKLNILKDSSIIVLSVVGLYISVDCFLYASNPVTKTYFATVSLLAFLSSKFHIKSLISDFEYMSESEERYLELIDEIEEMDPNDEEVTKLNKRLGIK